MKKENLILLITLPIAIIINLLLLNIPKAMINNFIISSKDTLTETKFESIMTDMNFKVINETIPEEVDYVISSQKAYKENEYEIYLTIYKDTKTAKNIYNYNKDNMSEYVKGMYSYKDISVNNYSKYTASSNYDYVVLIQHKNTMISISANKEYKKEINKIIKKLKY